MRFKLATLMRAFISLLMVTGHARAADVYPRGPLFDFTCGLDWAHKNYFDEARLFSKIFYNSYNKLAHANVIGQRVRMKLKEKRFSHSIDADDPEIVELISRFKEMDYKNYPNTLGENNWAGHWRRERAREFVETFEILLNSRRTLSPEGLSIWQQDLERRVGELQFRREDWRVLWKDLKLTFLDLDYTDIKKLHDAIRALEGKRVIDSEYFDGASSNFQTFVFQLRRAMNLTYFWRQRDHEEIEIRIEAALNSGGTKPEGWGSPPPPAPSSPPSTPPGHSFSDEGMYYEGTYYSSFEDLFREFCNSYSTSAGARQDADGDSDNRRNESYQERPRRPVPPVGLDEPIVPNKKDYSSEYPLIPNINLLMQIQIHHERLLLKDQVDEADLKKFLEFLKVSLPSEDLTELKREEYKKRIKKIYLAYHPDKNPDTEEVFKKIKSVEACLFAKYPHLE